jgi:hypothetical protein
MSNCTNKTGGSGVFLRKSLPPGRRLSRQAPVHPGHGRILKGKVTGARYVPVSYNHDVPGHTFRTVLCFISSFYLVVITVTCLVLL